jgi:hypothetical protein
MVPYEIDVLKKGLKKSMDLDFRDIQITDNNKTYFFLLT